MSKYFLREWVNWKKLSTLITPNKIWKKNPIDHFVKSIELKTWWKDVAWFTETKQLVQSSLDEILYIFSYIHYRIQWFEYYKFDNEKIDIKKLKEDIYDYFYSEINKWDFTKEDSIKLISAVNIGDWILLSFSYSNWKKNFLDINQESKEIEELMISWVYVSKNWFVSIFWLKKVWVWKNLEKIIEKIIATKLIPTFFHDFHFNSFLDKLNQVTKSWQFKSLKWQKIKDTMSRAESDSNLKELIEIWDFADIRWYLSEKDFSKINISMSKTKAFPKYTFSILKYISDDLLIKLVEFLFKVFIEDKEIDFLTKLNISSLELLGKKVRWDSHPFIALWKGRIPELQKLKENWIIEYWYRYIWKIKDNNLSYYTECKLENNIKINKLVLSNWEEKEIDDEVEYGIILNENNELLKEFNFDDEIWYYKRLELEEDKTKNIVVCITDKLPNDLTKILIDKLIINSEEELVLARFCSDNLKKWYSKEKPLLKNINIVSIKRDYNILWLVESEISVLFDLVFSIINWDTKNNELIKLFFNNEFDYLAVQKLLLANKPSLEVAELLVDKFKNVIETWLWTNLVQEYIKWKWSGRKEIERCLQDLFKFQIFWSFDYILPEINTSRWWIDFLALWINSYTIIEFKLANNPQIDNNLQFQTAVYEKTFSCSSKDISIIKVVFYDTEKSKQKVDKLIKEKNIDWRIVFIDYSDNKSASTVKNENEV